MQELTQSRLKELLSYDPETGVFTWLSGRRLGKIAGTPNAQGYLLIKISDTNHYAHRIAWLWHFGAFPASSIDHINCVKNDNRIANLRECSRTENSFNVGIRADNSSGFKGVSWCKRDRLWRAQIRIDGKPNYLGCFATSELANAAYQAKARDLHGEFYRKL